MQVVRVLADDPSVHLITATGPLDISNGLGQEAVLRVQSSIRSRGRWSTDANGLQMVERVRRDNTSRANYSVYEPAAQNYFPAAAMASLADESAGVSLAFDAAHGVYSPDDGALEVMLHRRIIDHGCRVDMGYEMNDTHRVIGTIRVQAPAKRGLGPAYRFDALRALHPIAVFITSVDQFYPQPLPPKVPALPANIHLHTLRVLGSDIRCDPFNLATCSGNRPRAPEGEVELLVRFQHLFGREDDAGSLTEPARVNVTAFLSCFGRLLDIRETTLTAAAFTNVDAHPSVFDAIQLQPLQIRTFLARLGH